MAIAGEKQRLARQSPRPSPARDDAADQDVSLCRKRPRIDEDCNAPVAQCDGRSSPLVESVPPSPCQFDESICNLQDDIIITGLDEFRAPEQPSDEPQSPVRIGVVEVAQDESSQLVDASIRVVSADKSTEDSHDPLRTWPFTGGRASILRLTDHFERQAVLDDIIAQLTTWLNNYMRSLPFRDHSSLEQHRQHRASWQQLGIAMLQLSQRHTLGDKFRFKGGRAVTHLGALITAYAELCALHLKAGLVNAFCDVDEPGSRKSSSSTLSAQLFPPLQALFHFLLDCPLWRGVVTESSGIPTHVRIEAASLFLTSSHHGAVLWDTIEDISTTSSKFKQAIESLMHLLEFASVLLSVIITDANAISKQEVFIARTAQYMRRALSTIVPWTLELADREHEYRYHEHLFGSLINLCEYLGHTKDDHAVDLIDHMLQPDSEQEIQRFKDQRSTRVALYHEHGHHFVRVAFTARLAQASLLRPGPAQRIYGIGIMSHALNDVTALVRHPSTASSLGPFLRQVCILLQELQVLRLVLDGLDHPVILREGIDVVRFHVYNGLFADAELDALWTTMNTSTNPEYIQVRVQVLIELVCTDLQLHQVVRLLSRFTPATTVSLAGPRLALITTILKRLSTHDFYRSQPETHCGILRLLLRLLPSAYGPSNLHLHPQVLTTIHFALSQGLPEPQLKDLVDDCVLAARGDGTLELAGVMVLVHMLAENIPSCRRLITKCLSTDTAVGILIAYVNKSRESTASAQDTCWKQALQHHISLAVYMLPSEANAQSRVAETTIWDYVVGAHAKDNSARSLGFSHLVALADKTPEIIDLLLRYTTIDLLILPSDYATSALLRLIPWVAELDGSCQEEYLLFQCLIKVYTRLFLSAGFTHADEIMVSGFLHGIMDVLYADKFLILRNDLEATQIVLVRECVDAVMKKGQNSCRALTLLRHSLEASLVSQERRSKAKDRYRPISEVDIALNMPECRTITILARPLSGQEKSLKLTFCPENTKTDFLATFTEHLGFRHCTFETPGGEHVRYTRKDSFAGPVWPHLMRARQLHVLQTATAHDLIHDETLATGRTTIETELLKHNEKITDLLDEPEPIARYAYILLARMRTPVRTKMTFDPATPKRHRIFSATSRWRFAYEAHVIRSILLDQTFYKCHTSELGENAMHLLVDLMRHHPVDDNQYALELIVDALLLCLKAWPRDSAVLRCLGPLDEFLDIIYKSLSRPCILVEPAPHDQSSNTIAKQLFGCLFEAASKCPPLRVAVKRHVPLNDLVHRTLLGPNRTLAKELADVMLGVCTGASADADLAEYLWQMAYQSLDDAIASERAQSHTLLCLLPDLLKSRCDLAPTTADIKAPMLRCISLLRSLTHEETFLSNEIDIRAFSLLKTLRICVEYSDSMDQDESYSDLASEIFTKFLFPPQDSRHFISVPLFHDESRAEAYAVLQTLCSEPATMDVLLTSIEGLIRWADLPSQFEGRQPATKSTCGLVGLWNLSQTCYMNSTLQQLYMNVPFRRFIFEVPVVDYPKQVVLYELKRAFAFLQQSVARAYLPDALAKALDVDVTSQEDAHIFFTVLLGKLEDNMPDQDAKSKLKSFFGGRNKSQIKGECGHVSETADEYYNLSLVVKDKSNLHESLEEYIRGSLLEGGDRYKCLSCEEEGRQSYVDAMQRTGLESIPDNVVIGLKRFRYESHDGGTKVNDRFTFPAQIDMSKYKLKHMVDSPMANEETDLFELVGVIVHQGTLQSGHYWSYAKGADTYGTMPGSWYRLEDQMTSETTLDHVMQATTGGPAPDATSPRDRTDSAYVLFYRRTSSTAGVEVGQCMAAVGHCPGPILEELGFAEHSTIVSAHMHHPDYEAFVVDLLSRFEQIPVKGADLDLDLRVLDIAHLYLNHISSRQRSLARFDSMVDLIKKLSLRSSSHAWHTLGMLTKEQPDFEYWFISAREPVRDVCNDLVLICINHIRSQASDMGLSHLLGQGDDDVVEVFVNRHKGLLDHLADQHEAWRTFFKLAGAIAELGSYETALLLDAGYLVWCLDALHTTTDDNHPRANRDMALWVEFEKLFDWQKLIDFVYVVLSSHVDIGSYNSNMTYRNAHDIIDDKCGLNGLEWELLLWNKRDYLSLFQELCDLYPLSKDNQSWVPGHLMALLLQRQVHPAVVAVILGALVDCLQEEDLDNKAQTKHVVAATIVCHASITNDTRKQLIEAVIHQHTDFDGPSPPLVDFMAVNLQKLPLFTLQRFMKWLPGLMETEDEDVSLAMLALLNKEVINRDIITVPISLETLRFDRVRLSTVSRLVIESSGSIRGQFPASYRAHVEAMRIGLRYLLRAVAVIDCSDEREVVLRLKDDWKIGSTTEMRPSSIRTKGITLSAYKASDNLSANFRSEMHGLADDCREYEALLASTGEEYEVVSAHNSEETELDEGRSRAREPSAETVMTLSDAQECDGTEIDSDPQTSHNEWRREESTSPETNDDEYESSITDDSRHAWSSTMSGHD